MVQKGIAEQRSEQAPTGYREEVRRIRYKAFQIFDGKYQPNQLFGGMENGNVVMLGLRPFLGEIGSKGRVPETDILGCVVEGVAQVSRATLLHVGITIQIDK